MSRQCPADYWYEPTDADMGYGGESEEREERTSTTTVRRARKARNGIRPGDLIQVESGFTFTKGAGRTGYFAKEEVLMRADGTFMVSTTSWWWKTYLNRMNPAQVAAVEALALAEAESRAADAAAKVTRAEWLRTPEGRAWTAAANQQSWARESRVWAAEMSRY